MIKTIKTYESGFTTNLNVGFDDTIFRLKESLCEKYFEIISVGEVLDMTDKHAAHQMARVLCKCNSNTTSKLLKSEKALYIPPTNFMVQEIGQNHTEVTLVDPQISMTSIQVDRMGKAIDKLQEMLKNIMQNL